MPFTKLQLQTRKCSFLSPGMPFFLITFSLEYPDVLNIALGKNTDNVKKKPEVLVNYKYILGRLSFVLKICIVFRIKWTVINNTIIYAKKQQIDLIACNINRKNLIFYTRKKWADSLKKIRSLPDTLPTVNL